MKQKSQLEIITDKILIERTISTQRSENKKRECAEINEAKRKYESEFQKLYDSIENMDSISSELIEWADQQKIDDARGTIGDGEGFYGNLISSAKSAYQHHREEGYEPQTAFDKGTYELISWISRSQQRNKGGIIYLNHSLAFLSRMRKIAEW